jgi:ankyrin repeat protein
MTHLSLPGDRESPGFTLTSHTKMYCKDCLMKKAENIKHYLNSIVSCLNIQQSDKPSLYCNGDPKHWIYNTVIENLHDINQIDKLRYHGSTLLELAVSNNHTGLVKWLLRRGANPNVSKSSILKKAIDENNIMMVNLLLMHNAKLIPNAQ